MTRSKEHVGADLGPDRTARTHRGRLDHVDRRMDLLERRASKAVPAAETWIKHALCWALPLNTLWLTGSLDAALPRAQGDAEAVGSARGAVAARPGRVVTTPRSPGGNPVFRVATSELAADT